MRVTDRMQMALGIRNILFRDLNFMLQRVALI